MAVDLSRVGLEGLETSERLLSSMAARRAVDQQTQQKQAEFELDQEERAIQQQALAAMADPSNKSTPSSLFNDVTDSQGAVLERLGELMISGGAVERGMDYLKAGVDIRDKESQMANRELEGTSKQLNNIISTADIFSRTVGVAKNESEWRYGLAQFRRHPEAVEIFGEDNLRAVEAMEFDPDVVAYFNEQALSHKDRASLDLQQQGEQRQQQSAQELSQFRRTTARIAEARAQESERHNRVMEKISGTGGSKAPTVDQIKTAEAAVANLVFGGRVPASDNEDSLSYAAFKSGAQDIASRAQQLVQDIPGLTFSAAVNRATMESLAAGDWETLKITEESDENSGRGTRFKGLGSTPSTPLAIPTLSNGTPVPGRMKAGSYYITSRGVAKWNGREFVKE